jgi:hypothetical protein
MIKETKVKASLAQDGIYKKMRHTVLMYTHAREQCLTCTASAIARIANLRIETSLNSIPSKELSSPASPRCIDS